MNLDSVASQLLGLGLPGVIIIVLLLVCRALFLKYEDAQTKRIEEGLANQRMLYEAITALQKTRGVL